MNSKKRILSGTQIKNVGNRAIRALAALLAALTILMLLPAAAYSDVDGAEGKRGVDFTSNTYISAKLQQLFDLLVYSSAPYFTTMGVSSCKNTACAECSLKAVCAQHPLLKDLGVSLNTIAYGSGAFARFAFYMIFGKSLSTINIYGNPTNNSGVETIGRVASGSMVLVGSYDAMTVDNLRAVLGRGTPGDIVQARSASGGNHTMILLSAGEDAATVLHSIDYMIDGYDYNRVMISEIPYDTMIKRWNQVISLMRAEEDTYKAAWSKGETTHTEHTYTDESKDACTVCGYLYTATRTYERAGAYKAAKNAVNYYGCYRSTGSPGGSFKQGEYIFATGSVVNSIGVVYYILEDGTCVCSEDFTKDTSDTPTIRGDNIPSGTLYMGQSFNLTGYFRMESKLSSIGGWIINEDGTVEQVKKMKAVDVSVTLATCDINTSLRFGALNEGKYLFMLTATGQNGRSSSLTSTFEVKRSAEKPTPAAPTAPTLASKTSTSVTLAAASGFEYRIGSGSWQSSPTFSGLQPATSYTFFRRLAETSTSNASPSSEGLVVTTEKGNSTAPTAPTLASKTSSSVTLTAVSGYEYRMNNGSWQSSPTFSGLLPATSYTFYRRKAETSSSSASPASEGLTVVTDKNSASAPSAPTLSAKSATSVTLSASSDCEYRMGSGSWQSSPTFTGLQPATSYTFYRRRAETSTTYASPSSAGLTVTTDKEEMPAAPAPTLSSRTSSSITLNAVEGCEYRRSDGTWQKSPVFSGLSPVTSYTFYQRYAATEKTAAGAQSAPATFSTSKASGKAAPAPSAKTVTASSVELVAVQGCEYRISGGSWQTSPVFRNLSAAVEYRFYQRYAETSSSYAGSESAALTVTTAKKSVSPPPAPTASKVTDTSVVLNGASGMEYSIDGGKTWQTSPSFTSLISNTSYSFTARYAETSNALPSGASGALVLKTDRSAQPAPSAPELSGVEDKKVTLKSESGMEYSADGGKTWQSSAVFTVSSYGKASFVRRRAQTDRCYASPASASLSVDVYPIALTSSALQIDGGAHTVTGASAGITCGALRAMFAEKDFVTIRKSADGDALPDGTLIFTGMTICLPSGVSYVLIVKGDVNGDGDVSVFDLSVIRSYILSGEALPAAQMEAADVDGDGDVNVFDYVRVRNCILDGSTL